jgi:hypothetical protein
VLHPLLKVGVSTIRRGPQRIVQEFSGRELRSQSSYERGRQAKTLLQSSRATSISACIPAAPSSSWRGFWFNAWSATEYRRSERGTVKRNRSAISSRYCRRRQHHPAPNPAAFFSRISENLYSVRLRSPLFAGHIPRKYFSLLDWSAGTQSNANPIRLPWPGKSDHFLPQSRLAFAFKSERKANPNRTYCKLRCRVLRVKFSGKVLLSATYG